MTKPNKVYIAGNIKVTVWGEKIKAYSFEKSYKVNEEWKKSTTFNTQDLLILSELCRKAFLDEKLKEF